jgi:hypothetical protein
MLHVTWADVEGGDYSPPTEYQQATLTDDLCQGLNESPD